MQPIWQIQQFEQNSTRRLTQWQDMAMMGLGSDKNTRKYKSISRSGSQVGWTETNKTNEGRLSIFFSVYELCQCFPAIKTVGRQSYKIQIQIHIQILNFFPVNLRNCMCQAVPILPELETFRSKEDFILATLQHVDKKENTSQKGASLSGKN